MNENLNLVDILKNVPKGTKLFSPLFGTVTFKRVDLSDYETYPVVVADSVGELHAFAGNGKYYAHRDGECLLFPSKENQDWSTFLILKPGDFVYRKLRSGNEWISIHKGVENNKVLSFVDICTDDWECNTNNTCLCDYPDDIVQQRKVTAEEDDLLMECLKNHGLTWDKDLLSLTKIYENKVELKPFQEVLVRDSQHDVWQMDFFSNMHSVNSEYPYRCFRNKWKYCIPYKGNEDKLGKV